MNAQKHTPGPWTVQRSIVPHDGEYDFAIHADGCPVLSEAFGLSAEGEKTPAEANARLIASAPDMLEALDRIFSYVSYVNTHGVGEQPEPNGLPQPMRVPPDEFARIFQEIGKLASSALSKAEGVQS